MTLGRIILISILLILLGCYGFVSYQIGKNSVKPIIDQIEKIDTLFKVDTLIYEKPVPKYITQTKTITDTLKTTDTISQFVEVEVPIERKVYSDDSTYTAWVSGYKAELDSIQVYHKTITINNEKIITKNNKQHFSISASAGVGYGVFTKKVEPFVGVTFNFPLFSK